MRSAKSTSLEQLLANPELSGSEIKAELTRLSSEIKQRRESGSATSRDFFISAVKALTRMRGSSNADLRMTSLFDCGFFFYTRGDSAHAVATARELQRLAEQCGDRSWIRKAHNFSGIVTADAGNLSAAMTHYMEALRLARELEDRESEAAGLINLGVALMYGGLYRDAIPCFERAADEARLRPTIRQWLPNALANLAQVNLYLENYQAGVKAISECLTLTTDSRDADSALSRTIREFTYVQLLLGLGQIDAARDHCARCGEHARAGDSARGKILATIASGSCEIHGGSAERGLKTLQLLDESASDSDWSRTDILIALVKGHDAAERPEDALHYLGKLLKHVRAEREKTTRALVGNAGILSTGDFATGGDLQPLENRELRLRAKTAERELFSAQIEMLERLAVTADIKEDESGEHGYRVGRLCAIMAGQLGWTKEACEAIDLAARLHDIGKIAMPDRILLTSEQLKEAERNLMSTHTSIGAELLAKSNIPQLQMAEEIARFHHEWWDGTGYPAKRSGKRIPIHARMVALADVFDALTHGRPFSEPWPMDRALDEIRARQGSQFDPELTDLFLAVVERLRREHTDLDAYLGEAGRSSPFLQARHKIRLMLADTPPAESPARERETVH